MYIESAVATYHSNTIALHETAAASLAGILSILDTVQQRTETRPPGIKELDLMIGDASSRRVGSSSDFWNTLSQGSIHNSRCRVHCSCRCHRSKRTRSVRLGHFQSVVGALVVVYSGWPYAGQYCDLNSCHNYGVSSFEVRYLFPRWYLDVSIVTLFRISHGYPTVGLTMQRPIADDSISKQQSILGTIEMA